MNRVPTVAAMIDLRCAKCSRRFGYKSGQQPRCYHCGALNDASEAEKLLAEIAEFRTQEDVMDAIVHAALRMTPRGHRSTAELYRHVAYQMGIDADQVVEFMMHAKPLETTDLERARAWITAQGLE